MLDVVIRRGIGEASHLLDPATSADILYVSSASNVVVDLWLTWIVLLDRIVRLTAG